MKSGERNELVIALQSPYRTESPLSCRRCANPATFRVAHGENGTIGYCLGCFRRLGDVPAGSIVNLVAPPRWRRPIRA